MNARLHWFPEMLTHLRQRRAEGVPIFRCAEEIGIGYASCVYKCRELGLADRLNHGRTAGMTIARRRDSRDSPEKPDSRREREENGR